MKPTAQTTLKQPSTGHGANAHRVQRSFPLTDFSYRPAAEASKIATSIAAPKKSEPTHLRPFWRLSSEYFAAEATWDFAGETILFAWISCLAAWPVSVMIYQLLTMTISPDLTGGWR